MRGAASRPETVEDVCAFVGGICPEMYSENAITKIRENEINGEVGTINVICARPCSFLTLLGLLYTSVLGIFFVSALCPY